MTHANNIVNSIPELHAQDFSHMRTPDDVMKLKRMGASFPSRLSFMKIMLLNAVENKWSFRKGKFNINENGVGYALYHLDTNERIYTLVAFAHHINPEERDDRVIAEKWDTTYALFDGLPKQKDIKRLSDNVPLQEKGRFSQNELSLSRANKSVRIFNHVVDSLAQGKQPDLNFIQNVGYILRTTAVYGSGKFGCADRFITQERPELNPPFQTEMITVYLIREFSLDLVEHFAQVQARKLGKKPASISPQIKQFLGIGNATGLGMAPFIIKHSTLIHRWVYAREFALMKIRNIKFMTEEKQAKIKKIIQKAKKHVNQWSVEDEIQNKKIIVLQKEIKTLQSNIKNILSEDFPCNKIYSIAEKQFSLETQELTVSILLETYSDMIDYLSSHMAEMKNTSYKNYSFDPHLNVGQLIKIIKEKYYWSIKEESLDQYNLWYYSLDKIEPRFSPRDNSLEPQKEMKINIARDVYLLYKELKKSPKQTLLRRFSLQHPEHRYIIKRICNLHELEYSEVRDNIISKGMKPIDLLRFKLAFFGAYKFDPKSDLWTRITLFQGAPLCNNISCQSVNDWYFPVL